MKSWSKNAATASGALLVAILVAEAVLQIFGVDFPIFRHADPVTGTAYIPKARGWFEKEGRAYVEINSRGQRDREREVEKPTNTVRIAVLGDSYSAALQVRLEDTYWSVMERELNAALTGGPRGVEVLNFGVDGYGTAQEYLTLHHKVWRYSPDLVLLAFLTGNDVADNHRELKREDHVPYFAYQGEDLVLDRSFVETPAYRARASRLARVLVGASRYSRLVQLINRARSEIKTGNVRANRSGSIDGENGVETGLSAQVYRDPSDPIWQEAWRVTEGILLLMAEEVRNEGAQMLVVTLTNGIQVHPDAQKRDEVVKRLNVPDLFYPDRRIERLCHRNRIPVLSLSPHFQRVSEQTGVFLHGFDDHLGSGHWNESGHKLAGRLIARKILEEVWSTLHGASEGA